MSLAALSSWRRKLKKVPAAEGRDRGERDFHFFFLMARICISVGIYCKTHTHTHAHTYICILARKPMWCRDGAMLEEPLRRVAMANCSPRKTALAIRRSPAPIDAWWVGGHGLRCHSWTPGGGVGSAASAQHSGVLSIRGLLAPLAGLGQNAPLPPHNQPAAAAGAAVNTCRPATTRTPATQPAEK